MANSPPVLQAGSLLRSEPRYHALVCLEYNNGFPRGEINIHHLRCKHGLKADVYRPALAPFEHESLTERWSGLCHPTDKSAPIERLKMRPGYVCTRC
jgi:hypothetical protein